MDAQTHLKDLCGFLRRRSELSHVEREGVIPEYWTGAANHIEMMLAREVALRAEVYTLTKDRDALAKIADRLLTDLERVVEGLDPEEARQVAEMRNIVIRSTCG